MILMAAVQMNSGNNKRKNLEKARILLQEGVDGGANFLALPENFSFMGKESDKVKAAEEIDGGESVEFLKSFAADHKVWILGGSIPLVAEQEGKVYNTSLLISEKGTVAARYDKIHLFDVDLSDREVYRESNYVKGGNKPVVVDTPFGKVGLSVCYDLRFPELYRKITLKGARFIFLPAAFTLHTGKDHWEVLIRARAIENQVYMIAPAQFGVHYKKRTTYGNSMIIDPWGKIMARASEKEMVITAELDISYQEKVRKSIPCLKHTVLTGYRS